MYVIHFTGELFIRDPMNYNIIVGPSVLVITGSGILGGIYLTIYTGIMRDTFYSWDIPLSRIVTNLFIAIGLLFSVYRWLEN